MKNYDQEGYSIFHKIKTKENLSNLQDIAAENFKNMNTDRGIKKDIKEKGFDYKSIKKHQEEERRKIREQIKELRELYKVEKQKLRDIKKNLSTDNRYQKDEKKKKYKLINEDIKNRSSKSRTNKNK